MIYLNQNLFLLDRQNVRENCTLFILFEQRVNELQSIHRDFINDFELVIKILVKYVIMSGESLIITFSFI